MYSYVPAFAIVTEPDAPGSIAPVLHEPSRAAIVWALCDVLVHVTACAGHRPDARRCHPVVVGPLDLAAGARDGEGR